MPSPTWYERARRIIAQLHADMPADIAFKERRQAVRDAYPWGRSSWPYKQWCRAQREYLAPYAPQKPMDIGLFADRQEPP